MILRGRVVDAEGRPQEGVKVTLRADQPVFAAPYSEGMRPQQSLEAETGRGGAYAFSIVCARAHGRAPRFSLSAVDGPRVSQAVEVEGADDALAAHDLVLRAGAFGSVLARWSDGAPAAGVSVLVILSERGGDDDDRRARGHSAAGTTDELGSFAFGPVPDCEYEGITVVSTHPEAPSTCPSWDGTRVRRDAPFEVTMVRGREVRGRLLSADGSPAVGYPVARLDISPGDAHATTDSDGRFVLAGVNRDGAKVAVYDRVRPQVGGVTIPIPLLNPILIISVPAAASDLGSVALPPLGHFAVRIEDARGERPLSGSFAWRWPDVSHSYTRTRADAEGLVGFERMPLGIAIEVEVTIEDERFGSLEERFEVGEVREGTVPLRVTGAGTVVVRLHPPGAPKEPLTVRRAYLEQHGHFGIVREDGPVSELRGWTPPGIYGALTVGAKGYHECVLEGVRVNCDGPTFLDVELEPR